MLNCQSLDPFVTPYIDGELSDEDRRAIDAHLLACAPCHSRVTAERAVHELIRTHQRDLRAECASASLRATCADIARLKPRAPSDTARAPGASAEAPGFSRAGQPAGASRWVARVTPYALAASLVVVVGGAFVYQATNQSARIMAAQLTADHLKCFAMNSALGTHQAASAVESSMLSSFGWSMRLPPEGGAGLELVGARPCLYGEGRVAHIMYRHAGRPVSLFMLPKSARTQELVEVLGHEAAIWCVGNRTFVLIAREPRPQVEQLASFVRAELH